MFKTLLCLLRFSYKGIRTDNEASCGNQNLTGTCSEVDLTVVTNEPAYTTLKQFRNTLLIFYDGTMAKDIHIYNKSP